MARLYLFFSRWLIYLGALIIWDDIEPGEARRVRRGVLKISANYAIFIGRGLRLYTKMNSLGCSRLACIQPARGAKPHWAGRVARMKSKLSTFSIACGGAILLAGGHCAYGSASVSGQGRFEKIVANPAWHGHPARVFQVIGKMPMPPLYAVCPAFLERLLRRQGIPPGRRDKS